MRRVGMTTDGDGVLVTAFPPWLADEVRTVVPVMAKASHPSTSPFLVEVSGETVTIPYRIHHDELPSDAERSLTATQRLIVHCLYSRHGDGRVRQRRLEQSISSGEPWVAPFAVRLIGEYVLEVLEAIRRGLPELVVPGSASWLLYGDFVARNPTFFARTERQVVSYRRPAPPAPDTRGGRGRGRAGRYFVGVALSAALTRASGVTAPA